MQRVTRPTAWFVYLVRTHAGALYTGITTDVDRRVAMHASARGAKCLRGRGTLELAYSRRIGDRALASRAEYAIKRLKKPEKEGLVDAAPTRRRLLRMLGVTGTRSTRSHD